MKQYWGITPLIGDLFLLVEALGVPLLTDSSPWLQRGRVLAALVGVGLFVAGLFRLIGRRVGSRLPDSASHRGTGGPWVP